MIRTIFRVLALVLGCIAFTGIAFGLAVMQTPTPGSTLSGSSVTFTWSADTGATAYWLDVGNVAGGNEYYQSGNLGNVFSTTVTTLPTDGSTVYVTLYSLIGGVWSGTGYTYTAFNVATAGGVLTTPTPGSTLTGSSVTFDWTAGTGASAYWLDVGSTVGGNQYYQSGNLGNVLTTTANGLPTNGSTIYVTLNSLIGGVWSGTGYTYTAFNVASAGGVLTTPTPGSTLTGSSVAFDWTAGAGASAYWLDLGSTVGGNQYYQSGNLGNVLTTTANGLPTNGSTIYVTLHSLVGGVWSGTGYTYTAYNVASAGGILTTPTPGSMLSGSSVTFGWTAGAGASAYWLDVGSTVGGNQYYQSGNLGNVLTTTVNGLPTDGSTIYVTLHSLIGGAWSGTGYTYTAFNLTGAGLAVMQTPTPGSTLTGSNVTFDWSAGSGATAYWLDVGNVTGGNQYYQSGNLGTALTTTVTGLPTNGSSTVYVTLYSLIAGEWLSNAYTYTAFNVASAGGVLTTPTPGSTLTGSSVTFDWTAGAGASAYWLDVGSAVGGNQYYQSGNLGTALTTTVSGLPTNGSTIYVTLHSLIGGVWSGTGYTYTALNATSGLAVMQTPTPDSTLIGRVATFTWSSDASASGYWVDIGSTEGGNDINQSGNLGTVLTTTVYSLPSDGSTIYVTLYSLVGGQWLSNAYTYDSDPILTYSARADNCVNGTQSGCISGATTGEAGATLLFQEGVSDPIPTGFTPTTISSGSCPSGSTPSSYPAYCPTPMNSTATDPDFGSYLVMATDDDTNAHNSATPYTASWNVASDGNWDAFSWDETLYLAKNSGGGATILNLNPVAIHAQTCATAPGCVNGSGIYPALNGAGDSTHLAHGGSWSFSRVPSEPNVLYELSNLSTQVNRLVITSSIAAPGTGTLTRTLYADFVNGTGSYGGVMNSACPGNPTTYSNTWTGSFQLADDGTVSYGLTGGYDWPGASQAVVSPDCFILPTVGNSGKYGFQATTGGTTGTSEPAWSTCSTVGSTCTDGSVTWTNIGKLAGQGLGFDMLIYGPPGSADPGYTRINTRLGKIYRGTGNAAPAGLMTTNDEVVCTRAGTWPTVPCNLPDRFTLHEVEQGENGQYSEFSPTGGEAANPPGSWNSGTLSCQTSNASWQGAWSAAATYSHLNVVSYAGYFWSATTASENMGHPPPSSGWPTGNTYWTGTEAYCSSYFFDVTSTLVAPLTDWMHGSGHSAAGYLHKYYGHFYDSMLYSLPVIDGVLNPDTPMLLAALPCDDHGTYQNSGINDLSPIFTATADVPAWPTRYDVPNGACYDEICAFNSGGSGLTYRFGHTYNTGSSSNFSIQNNIGVNSPFGDLIAFGTDMMGVRGSNASANTPCNNLRGQYQPAPNGPVTYQDYVYPITDNNGANIFRATSCGSNTTGATCTEGSPLPNWDSTCGTLNSTCTDGGVTWTNEGPNNCRGDIVIMDVLSAHPAQ